MNGLLDKMYDDQLEKVLGLRETGEDEDQLAVEIGRLNVIAKIQTENEKGQVNWSKYWGKYEPVAFKLLEAGEITAEEYTDFVVSLKGVQDVSDDGK